MPTTGRPCTGRARRSDAHAGATDPVQRPNMKASTNASWAMSGASSRSPHRATAEATAMSSQRSMSAGQAETSPR
jgi:hypothetical protein